MSTRMGFHCLKVPCPLGNCQVRSPRGAESVAVYNSKMPAHASCHIGEVLEATNPSLLGRRLNSRSNLEERRRIASPSEHQHFSSQKVTLGTSPTRPS